MMLAGNFNFYNVDKSFLKKSSNGFGRMDSYMKLDQLGEGSYATVYKVFSNVLNRIVALKEIRLQAEEGAPFTAIREGMLTVSDCTINL